MPDFLQTVSHILDGYRNDLADFEHTVDLLESCYAQQPSDLRQHFFDPLRSQFLSENYSHLHGRRTIHTVAIRSWARFGPADQLPSTVFALCNKWNDTETMESWARVIAPEFAHSLWSYRGRFSKYALSIVKAQCALFTSADTQTLVGSRFPASLMEVARRLDRIVEKINFERFEETVVPSGLGPSSDVVSQGFSLLDLKHEILKVVGRSRPRAINKYNLMGRPPAKGELELALGRTLSDAERNRAYRAFDELKKTNHIKPTYTDLADPENWVVLTALGEKALTSGVLDDLDHALAQVAPHLMKLRRGAWSALRSGEPHSLEQAAHSARELVDQALKIGAPDEEVQSQSWYSPDPSSTSGVTRRMRLKLLMQKYAGELSETDLRVAEKASDFVLAVNEKLIALAHSRIEPNLDEVEAAITSAEIAMRSVLTSFGGSKTAREIEGAGPDGG
jgi:Predicted pPIWI-associating nuclease